MKITPNNTAEEVQMKLSVPDQLLSWLADLFNWLINISIPPLKPGERIEEWQPLFVAATSSLAAHTGEPAVVQILPSYVGRDEYERDITLLAIKEKQWRPLLRFYAMH